MHTQVGHAAPGVNIFDLQAAELFPAKAVVQERRQDSSISQAFEPLVRRQSHELPGLLVRDRLLPISLPGFDIATLTEVLALNLPDLEAAAAAQVREHLRSLGNGGEAWVNDGMTRVDSASGGKPHDTCPFCAQNLASSPIIQHYQAYFSRTYERLKSAIDEMVQGVNRQHGGDVPAHSSGLFGLRLRTVSFGTTSPTYPQPM